MFLLIDNYDSFTYNVYALLVKCGITPEIIKNNNFKYYKNLKGIIISPGPSSPENSGSSLQYIDYYIGKVPILGICLGMQCIGYYLNYKIKKASSVKHGKIDNINILQKKILFQNVNSGFQAVRYHSLAVNINYKNSLVTAVADSDKEVMAIEDKNLKVFGVQFHPESFLSNEGKKIFINFKNFC